MNFKLFEFYTTEDKHSVFIQIICCTYALTNHYPPNLTFNEPKFFIFSFLRFLKSDKNSIRGISSKLLFSLKHLIFSPSYETLEYRLRDRKDLILINK